MAENDITLNRKERKRLNDIFHMIRDGDIDFDDYDGLRPARKSFWLWLHGIA